MTLAHVRVDLIEHSISLKVQPPYQYSQRDSRLCGKTYVSLWEFDIRVRISICRWHSSRHCIPSGHLSVNITVARQQGEDQHLLVDSREVKR